MAKLAAVPSAARLFAGVEHRGRRMKIGYTRTLTLEQGIDLEAQLRDLKAAGIEKIFSEQLSSMDAERPQLQAALAFLQKGDILVITEIDRIAQSVAHLCEIEARLDAKGACLKVITPELDTSTSTGRLDLRVQLLIRTLSDTAVRNVAPRGVTRRRVGQDARI
jgi:DNA invertase Pin-like site-specific DNA recombinase